MEENFSYCVGYYWTGSSGQICVYSYGTQIQYGTMTDANRFLNYVKSKVEEPEARRYQIFKLDLLSEKLLSRSEGKGIEVSEQQIADIKKIIQCTAMCKENPGKHNLTNLDEAAGEIVEYYMNNCTILADDIRESPSIEAAEMEKVLQGDYFIHLACLNKPVLKALRVEGSAIFFSESEWIGQHSAIKVDLSSLQSPQQKDGVSLDRSGNTGGDCTYG